MKRCNEVPATLYVPRGTSLAAVVFARLAAFLFPVCVIPGRVQYNPGPDEGDEAMSAPITSPPGDTQEIISMGEAVVPLMLRDLEQQPRLWVWALPDITGEDPVPEADAGNIRKMSEAWLRWGKEHGYRC
jgi:hypothetical protein